MVLSGRMTEPLGERQHRQRVIGPRRLHRARANINAKTLAFVRFGGPSPTLQRTFRLTVSLTAP